MKTDNGGLLPLFVVVAGLVLLFQFQSEQSYRRQISDLQQQLQDVETRFQSYREGVMSHD